MEEYSKQAQGIVNNIIDFSQQNNGLLSKFNENFFVEFFDRQNIKRFQKLLAHAQQQISLQQFVKNALLIIDHEKHQTIYLAISLKDLFLQLRQTTKSESAIMLQDFTNFLCERISSEDPDLVMPLKKVPNQRMRPDVSRIREIDLNPPIVLNKSNRQLPKVSMQKRNKNKKLIQKKAVGHFVYSQKMKRILTLGRLSSQIEVYDIQLNLKKRIIPKKSLSLTKDIAILSFAFSQEYQRICLIINNIGLVFMQAFDDFKTQKIISKCFGQQVYYLPLFNQWVTTDKNTVYFWDLKQQVVSRKIRKDKATMINDVCQIDHIRAIAISTVFSNQQKAIFIYQNDKQISKIQVGSAGSHTLEFNKFTQTLISLGYKASVSIYEINNQTYDTNLLTQLQGHASIISCVSQVPGTSIIITGDDCGFVRVWDLNYMRCIQVTRVSKFLNIIECIGEALIFADSRMNVIKMENLKNKQKQDIHGFYKFYDSQHQKIWVVTKKGVRIIDVHTAKTQKIYVICNQTQQEQISAAAHIKTGVLLGTTKGQIFNYSFDGKLKWKMSAHDGEVTAIKADWNSRTFISSGQDSNLHIWPDKDASEIGPMKSLLNNFHSRQINYIDFSEKFNVLITVSQQLRQIHIWDYQNLKLLVVMPLPAIPICVKVSNEIPMFVLSLNNQVVYIFKFKLKSSGLKIKLISVACQGSKILEFNTEQNNINILKKTSLDYQVQNKQNENINQDNSYGNAYLMDLDLSGKRKYLICNTNKVGAILLDISIIIRNNFTIKDLEATSNKKAGRFISQNFQRQYSKKQYKIYDIQNLIEQPISLPRLFWVKKLHKEPVTHLQLIKLKKKYLFTISADGYIKFFETKSNELAASLQLSQPLPMKWNIEIESNIHLKKSIYDTMLILDAILNDQEEYIPKKNYQKIEISSFLKMMCSRNLRTKSQENKQKRDKQPILLDSQFNIEDLQRHLPEQASLQSLQAYKRIKKIKHSKQNYLSFHEGSKRKKGFQTRPAEVDAIHELLAPNYFPKLMNSHASQKQKQQQKQNKLDQTKIGSILALISLGFNVNRRRKRTARVMIQKKQRLVDSLAYQEKKQTIDKPAKLILRELNNKLSIHKKSIRAKNLLQKA